MVLSEHLLGFLIRSTSASSPGRGSASGPKADTERHGRTSAKGHKRHAKIHQASFSGFAVGCDFAVSFIVAIAPRIATGISGSSAIGNQRPTHR